MKLYYVAEHIARQSIQLPLFLATVPAGFPSPAEDYMDKRLDLNEYLIQHQAATFFCRVSGHSMRGVGIFDGDLLIVDRAIEPQHQSIVVASIDGELTCKILDTKRRLLLSANKDYPPIAIKEDAGFLVEGVVTNSIRCHVRTG